MTTRVISVFDAPEGWQSNPDYVYIGRENRNYGLPRSFWANPYVIGVDGNRDEVIDLYERRIQARLKPQDLEPLRGKILVCWCKRGGKDTPCHGDVLVALLGENEPQPRQMEMFGR